MIGAVTGSGAYASGFSTASLSSGGAGRPDVSASEARQAGQQSLETERSQPVSRPDLPEAVLAIGGTFRTPGSVDGSVGADARGKYDLESPISDAQHRLTGSVDRAPSIFAEPSNPSAGGRGARLDVQA